MSTAISFKNIDIHPFYVGGASATLSRDGAILATAVEEDIIITNLETNETMHRLEGDGELVTVLELTPNGKYLGIVSQSQQLRIFNVESGEFEKNHKLSSPVYISSSDPTSTLFAFGGSDGVVTVWDVENGFVTHSLKGHGTTVCSLEFYGELNGSDWKLISGDIRGSVKIWDLVKRKCVKNIEEHNSAVRGVAFNHDGSKIITGGRDEILVVYDAKFKVMKTLIIGQQIENCGFCLIDNVEYMFTAGSKNVFKLWDTVEYNVIAESEKQLETNEELIIIDVLSREDGNFLLVLSDQTLVELIVNIDLTKEKSSSLIELPIAKRYAGNHGIISDMKYVGPGFGLVGLATNSPALRIVDLSKPLEMQILQGHKDLLNSIDVSVCGEWIATGSKDNEARLWKWDSASNNFKNVAVFKGHSDSITAVCLPKTPIQNYPKFLVTSSNDLTIKKWNINKEILIEFQNYKVSEYTRRAHEKEINSIDISPNDEFLATASFDKTGKIWDLETGETVGILKGHKRGLWDIKFCRFDKFIVTGSSDKTVKLWSLTNFQCTKTFEGHTNSIQRCNFFGLEHIISTGADGLIKVWDFKSKNENECVKTLDNHEEKIWAFDLKNEGEEFISADSDGNISHWINNSEELQVQQEIEYKLKFEQEQKLSNLMNERNWTEAFKLALKLNHSMKMYNIIKYALKDKKDKSSKLGDAELENLFGNLSDEDMIKIFEKLRDWNINNKFFTISQLLIRVIIQQNSVDRLSEIKGLVRIIESIVPYSERHFSRLDDMIEESSIIEYTIQAMEV